MKKIFVKDIGDGDSVNDLFLVKRKGKGVSKNGAPYLAVTFSDSTGDIDGRVWERAEEFDKIFDIHDFVRIEARASIYQGRPQLSIQDISWVDEKEVSLNDFLRSSSKDLALLEKELRTVMSGIADKNIKRLVFAFMDDPEFAKAFARSPAATSVHHAYIGGLLEHIHSMAALAVKLCEHYPQLDRDLVLAGVFFHDIGKTRELTVKSFFDYSDDGKLIGHIVIGCEMIEERAAALKEFPAKTKTVLKHLVLSHHGLLEFGSPKVPMTPEAFALHCIDDLDAKLNVAWSMLKDVEPGEWSDFNKFLNRNLYRTDSKAQTTGAGQPKPAKKKKEAGDEEPDLFR